MATLKTKIQLRRDTAENLKDVKLEVGEPGYATDTKKFVIGDNSTKFSDLKGRVMGPNASTDNALAKFDGTSGQIIQNSNATLNDAGQLKVVNWKDERYASNVAMSRWTTTAKEIIIYTKIKFVSSSVMPIVRLHGYAYGQNAPIELKIGFYIYNNNYTNFGAVSMGAWRPEIRLFKYTASDSVDYVAIGFIGTCYYGGFQVDVQAAALGTLDSNILTTGWSVSTFTTEGNVPAVGTDKSTKVPYKSTLANLTINGTVYNGSSNVTFNLAEADHNHDDDYLKEEADTLQTVTNRGATTTKAITTAGLTTTSGYVNITGTSGFSEGVRLHSVGNLSSVWWNATADKDYCTNGMWGITAYDYGYSDSAKKNTFRFRGPTSQTATSPTDQMWIDSTGLVTSRGGFAKSGSSDSYILLAGGGTKAVSDFALDSEIPDVSDFVTKSTAQTITGNKTFTGNVVTSNNKFEIKANSNTDDSWIKLTNKSDTGYYAFGIRRPYDSYGLQLKIHGTDGTDTYYDIWHAGNDGSGSGLDADKLDGQEGSYYLNYNNLTNKPTIPTKDSWNYDDTYVKYNAAQTLTDAQKTQARANIGAGTSNFSGNYNDLTNKPTIPTVNNGTLTIQKNGTTVATFTANQSGNATANITVPNPTDYYWANVKVSSSSSTATTPSVQKIGITGSATTTASAAVTMEYDGSYRALKFVFA